MRPGGHRSHRGVPETLRGYGCLAFLGWNTMTEEHYGNLVDFRARGRDALPVGAAPFDADAHRSAAAVHPRRRRARAVRRADRRREWEIEEVLFTEHATDPRCAMPLGSLYLEPAKLAKIEAGRRAGARGVARQREAGTFQCSSNTAWARERSISSHVGLPRRPAGCAHYRHPPHARESQQGDIAVRGSDVYYAVYDGALPSGLKASVVYLVNHDIYGQTHHPSLVVQGKHEFSISVPGGGCGSRG